MAARQPVDVLAAGLVTPVGLTARATAAAVRAGITRLRETGIHDRKLKPVVAGFLDEPYLPELPAPLRQATRTATARHERMLRLAAPALQEAAQAAMGPMALLLALPESSVNAEDPVGPDFLEHLAALVPGVIDLKQSQSFRLGRAGGLFALDQALKLLQGGRASQVLVGGVDSLVDLSLLATLDAEERLRGLGLSDGLVPGEAAAFLWLGAKGVRTTRPQAVLARVSGVGTGHEEGHRYSEKPYRGEGLAQAFRRLFASLARPAPPIRHVQAGFNGESFGAKEWGVAYLRHTRHFAERLRIEHPVEFIGDPGAALGPLLMSLAALGIQRGYREAPCLVCCSSDREERGAALVEP